MIFMSLIARTNYISNRLQAGFLARNLPKSPFPFATANSGTMPFGFPRTSRNGCSQQRDCPGFAPGSLYNIPKKSEPALRLFSSQRAIKQTKTLLPSLTETNLTCQTKIKNFSLSSQVDNNTHQSHYRQHADTQRNHKQPHKSLILPAYNILQIPVARCERL